MPARIVSQHQNFHGDVVFRLDCGCEAAVDPVSLVGPSSVGIMQAVIDLQAQHDCPVSVAGGWYRTVVQD